MNQAAYVRVQCPGCQRTYQAPSAAVGKRMKCPHCATQFVAAPMVTQQPPPAVVKAVAPSQPAAVRAVAPATGALPIAKPVLPRGQVVPPVGPAATPIVAAVQPSTPAPLGEFSSSMEDLLSQELPGGASLPTKRAAAAPVLQIQTKRRSTASSARNSTLASLAAGVTSLAVSVLFIARLAIVMNSVFSAPRAIANIRPPAAAPAGNAVIAAPNNVVTAPPTRSGRANSQCL